MTDHDALIALNAIEGLGNARIQRLVEKFGSAKEVFHLSAFELSESQILPVNVVDNIIRFPKDQFLEKELASFQKLNSKVLSLWDDDYPQSLKQIPDAPVVLYQKGPMDLKQMMGLAIVGSRKASIYGLTTARQFAQQLSEMGITIISGLAQGIDTAAHQGALQAMAPTVAVLGSGLSEIYPSENKELSDRIAEQGCLLSEFPLTHPPRPFNFPRRNRIISGLSLAVLVVEASEKSGALITADCALEQGKDVFAIPGKIDSPMSGGVHKLIKQGAALVTCVEDVLENLKDDINMRLHKEGLKINQINEDQKNILEKLTENEQLVYNHIGLKSVCMDELCENTGMEVSCLSGLLLQLELKKIVKQLPDRQFVRVARVR